MWQITAGKISPIDSPTRQDQTGQCRWRNKPLPVCCWRLQFARVTVNEIENREPRGRGQSETERDTNKHRQDCQCGRDLSAPAIAALRPLPHRLDRQPCDQEQQHQNYVRKSAGDDEVNKWRWPEESPFRSLLIQCTLGTPPRPGQPRERAERAEPIGRAPANDPAI